MERGTDREREALERAWATRERRRRRTNRLLSGLLFVSAGAVLALVAVVVAELCLPAMAVTEAQCIHPSVDPGTRVASALLGVILAAVGGGQIRQALAAGDRGHVRRPR